MSQVLSDYDPRRSYIQQHPSCAKPKHPLQIKAEKHRRISQGVVYNVARHSGEVTIYLSIYLFIYKYMNLK
jgi:hypothetical protein